MSIPTCPDSEASAWKHVYRLKKADRSHDGTVTTSVHEYLLACCRRIWPLLPDSGSRMGVEAAERYRRGEITWAEARETDWYSEASAFLFHYSESDREIASFVAQVSRDRDALQRLLVPACSFHEQSVRELLRDAAYFANFALNYPGIRLGKYGKVHLKDYGKFMPLELFEAMVPGTVDR